MSYHLCFPRALLAQTLFASVVALGQRPPPAPPRLAGLVIFHLVDSYGNPLAASDVTSLTVLSEAGKDLSPKKFEGTLQGLTYGDYSIRLLVPGFRYWTGSVRVDKPITWVTVGVQLGGVEGEPMCALSGTLVGFQQTPTPVWIRLIQLYSNDVVESEVDSKGFFNIARAPCGKYILAVMGDKSPIRLMTVTLKLAMDPLSVPFSNVGR